MAASPLHDFPDLGPGVWLACSDPFRLRADDLRALVEGFGVVGVACGPCIDVVRPECREAVQRLADRLLPIFRQTAGREGYVSVGVLPERAYDTQGIIDDAQTLVRRMERPNLMVDVPSTRAGLLALRHLTGEGVAVHASLLYSLSRYLEATDAYLTGLEVHQARERHRACPAGLVSFGVRAIDDAVDAVLEVAALRSPDRSGTLMALKGRAGIASARLVYRAFRRIFTSRRFLDLAKRGGNVQRIAWKAAPVGSSQPAEARPEAVWNAPGTVRLLSPDALHRSQETPHVQEYGSVGDARRVVRRLSAAGVNLERVAWQLEARAVQHRIRCRARSVSSLPTSG